MSEINCGNCCDRQVKRNNVYECFTIYKSYNIESTHSLIRWMLVLATVEQEKNRRLLYSILETRTGKISVRSFKILSDSPRSFTSRSRFNAATRGEFNESKSIIVLLIVTPIRDYARMFKITLDSFTIQPFYAMPQ